MNIKVINGYPFVHYKTDVHSDESVMSKSHAFNSLMQRRRSVRQFSDRQVPLSVIETIISTAASAPSGANRQPWTFCVVSDAGLKKEIRSAAEKEEKENYQGRMPEEWLNDLKPLQTDWHKEFLETAPYLIVVFKRSFDVEEEGAKHKNYYVAESVGIACGFLLAAIHQAGLAALTHTPSPMNFLQKILRRPENEKPFLLIPVGYASEDCYVPDITRKRLGEVMVCY